MPKGPSESQNPNITSAQQILDQVKNVHDPKKIEQAATTLLKYYQELNESGMMSSLLPIEEERGLIRDAIKLIKRGDKNAYRQSLKTLRQAVSLLGENVREQVEETLAIPERGVEPPETGLDPDELFANLEDEPEESENHLFTAPVKAGDDEERMTTGEIEKLSQDLDEILRKTDDGEKEKRALLRRLDLKLYKTVKSLFDVLDFEPEKIEEEGLQMILQDMQAKIQETIDLIDLDELKELAKKPYLEIKKEMEKHGEGLKALWEDMKEVLEEEGLLEILKAEAKKTASGSLNKTIELGDEDLEEVQPEPETPPVPSAFSQPPAPTPPRPAPPRAPATSPPAPQPMPESHSAPSMEETIQLMENDEPTRELLGKLEIIRAAFGEVENYEQTGTPPEGIKDDWNTFKEIFDKRMAKSNPLIMSSAREVLAASYIDLLKQNKPDLFTGSGWDETAFLTEMAKRLKLVYINNKKLLKD